MEKYDVISKEIRKIQKDLKKLNERKSQLYEDYTLKLIDEKQYVEFKDRDAFVDTILVEEDGNLNIKLSYDDMLKELVEFARTKEAGDDCE